MQGGRGRVRDTISYSGAGAQCPSPPPRMVKGCSPHELLPIVFQLKRCVHVCDVQQVHDEWPRMPENRFLANFLYREEIQFMLKYMGEGMGILY